MNIAGNTALEGFICPACLVDFPSASKLQDHWVKFHSPKVATNSSRSERISNDYEDIPDDSSPGFAPQVCVLLFRQCRIREKFCICDFLSDVRGFSQRDFCDIFASRMEAL